MFCLVACQIAGPQACRQCNRLRKCYTQPFPGDGVHSPRGISDEGNITAPHTPQRSISRHSSSFRRRSLQFRATARSTAAMPADLLPCAFWNRAMRAPHRLDRDQRRWRIPDSACPSKPPCDRSMESLGNVAGTRIASGAGNVPRDQPSVARANLTHPRQQSTECARYGCRIERCQKQCR